MALPIPHPAERLSYCLAARGEQNTVSPVCRIEIIALSSCCDRGSNPDGLPPSSSSRFGSINSTGSPVELLMFCVRLSRRIGWTSDQLWGARCFTVVFEIHAFYLAHFFLTIIKRNDFFETDETRTDPDKMVFYDKAWMASLSQSCFIIQSHLCFII